MALNQMDVDLSRITRNVYPAPTDKESAALQVIRFTVADLGTEPKNREVIARLSAEFEPVLDD